VASEHDRKALLESADLVLKVMPPLGASSGRGEIACMRPGHDASGLTDAPTQSGRGARLAERHVTAFSTDAIPRITRAQAMDRLSSMANISGYKGVLLAAVALNKYFPMRMTAAGMVAPARVFVIGAGVAGLQAIATARRLGANVVATDVRPVVKEQIESVGAKYVGIKSGHVARPLLGFRQRLADSPVTTGGEPPDSTCVARHLACE
jgi:NAD(P) transhydrogenase subunit alpha